MRSPIKVLGSRLALEIGACSLDELTGIAIIVLKALKHDEFRAGIVLALADADITLPEENHGQLQAKLVKERHEKRAKLQAGLQSRHAAKKAAEASKAESNAPGNTEPKGDVVKPVGQNLVAIKNK